MGSTRELIFLFFPLLFLGLKQVVQSEGVWRIRKLERSHVIEVVKMEESGHGDLLSSSFKSWRESMAETVHESQDAGH